MSIKIASMNFGDCDTILHNTSNGMKNIAEVLGPNGEVYWSAIKEITGIPPLSIRSNGTILLDYLISGNMSQASGVSPDNPIMPQSTGERTGNLWDEDYTGINTNAIYRPLFVGDGVFTLSTNFKPDRGLTDIFLLSGNVSSGISSSTNGAYEGKNITAQSVNGYITIAYRANARQSSGSLPYCKTMLNSGVTALPYEPYGYKIPISSANTTTPVYLGEVESTRKIGKLVLTGQETNWIINSNAEMTNTIYVYMATVFRGDALNLSLCSHFIYKNVFLTDEQAFHFVANQYGSLRFRVDKTIAVDLTAWKAYLAQQYAAGTPVCVWYVLAEPTTGIVNEPLRKIGDYADTLSMEQAGVQIPTNKGNTVIDVETTLKPSQMHIKYK